jgi:formylglycine-generating enzyme required for sulfatase activity
MAVSPETITVDALGQEIQFSATVWDQLGRVLPDAAITWYTSDEKIATVTPSGLATTVGDGTVTILAAASSVFGWGEMTVTAKPLAIITSALAPGVVGLPYSRTLEAEGSNALAWTLTDGALPVGLSLNQSTGEISGIPTEKGIDGFTVMLTGAGQAVTRAFVIVVVEEFLGSGFDEDQFALVSAGSFQMGSAEGYTNVRSVHTVNITRPFLMQKTEVTQYQWKTVMGTEPSYWANCGDICPVERTSWNDVQVFLYALNAMDPGKNYRLPTEAQWEYAARAGTTGDYGGTEVLEEMGWYTVNSGITQIVGQKEPNAWGLYDMHGNVAEWVLDWYGADYYALSPSNDPPGPEGGIRRVNRGGNAGSAARFVTSWYRSHLDPLGGDPFLGFRLVRDP